MQFRDGKEAAVAVEVVGEQQVDRSGNVARDRIDRFELARVACWVAAVDDDATGGDVSLDVDRIGQRIERPVDRRTLGGLAR